MAVTDKYPASAADLLRGAERQVSACLPANWSARLTTGVRVGEPRGKAVLRVASSSGEQATFLVDIRQQPPAPGAAEAAALRMQASLLEAGSSATGWEKLIVAPFIGPAARERLTELGVGYVDMTGNVRLVAERPALAITAAGANKPARTKGPTLAGLSGRAALQVVRALVDIDMALPVTTEIISTASGTSVAQAWRVVQLLEAEGIVMRDSRGRLSQYDWRAVLMRLLEDYSFERRAKPAAYLTLQGPERALEALRTISEVGSVAVTGSRAAQLYSPLAPPRSLELWAESPDAVAEALGAVPADRAADLLIAAPYAPIVFKRNKLEDGINYCAPSQVVADLWNGPGRSRQQAEAVLEWMARDDSWRS